MPVFSFGENEVYDQVENQRGTWLRSLQERLQRVMGISLPLFHARGIFQYSFGVIPYRRPINTVGEQKREPAVDLRGPDLLTLPQVTQNVMPVHLE